MTDAPKKVLLLPGPDSQAAAEFYFKDTYEYGSWLSHQWSNQEATPYSNGALSRYEGREVWLWDAPMQSIDTAPVLRALFNVAKEVWVVGAPPEQPQLEPLAAKALGKPLADVIAWARKHKDKLTEAPPEPPPPDEDLPPPRDFTMPDDDPWGAPIDLWLERPLPRLDPGWLPFPLGDFVQEQAALTGTDPTVIGLSCLVACASVINDGLRVQPKAHDSTWTESARLWGVVVGDPSSKKSPGIAKAIHPLRSIDAKLSMASKDELREYEETFQQWSRSKDPSKGPPPVKPICPRVLVNDTTTESLSDILADNAQGLMVYRDELAGWFGSMDAYSGKGNSKDRAFWLEAYNGGTRRVDRVTKGHIIIPNCSVCLLGGIQPGVFAKTARNVEEDGLLQRFIVVIAANATDDEDREPNDAVIMRYTDLIQNLHALEPRFGFDKEVYKLTEEAQMIRRVFMDTVKALLRTRAYEPQLLGYLGKWDGLFARLLCTYHVVQYTANGNRPAQYIDEATATRVVLFMEQLLLPHAEEFYETVLATSQRRSIARWIAGMVLAKKMPTVGTRDVTVACHPYRDAPDDHVRRGAWGALQDAEWVRPSPTARMNRHTGIATQWEVNPLVHELFAERAKIEVKERAAKRAAIDAAIELRRASRASNT
jgi:hypothetical protein